MKHNIRFTPTKITHLEDGEIFVFGSNESGIHGAGAAKLAYQKFGAIWKQGVGLQGNCYAIPTKDYSIKTLDLNEISDYVKQFLIFAESREDLTFLVTEIGCGLAGYHAKDIAPFFKNVPLNVVLPESFIKIIKGY